MTHKNKGGRPAIYSPGMQIGVFVLVERVKADNRGRWLVRCSVCGKERVRYMQSIRADKGRGCHCDKPQRRSRRSRSPKVVKIKQPAITSAEWQKVIQSGRRSGDRVSQGEMREAMKATPLLDNCMTVFFGVRYTMKNGQYREVRE